MDAVDTRRRPRRLARHRGQSLVEACLCILLVSLVFAGLFQISRLFAAREILDHAANRSARAQAVGLNRFMTVKAARVAAIPNAGRMRVPEFENIDSALRTAVQTLSPGDLWSHAVSTVPVSQQVDIERARIPWYLSAVDHWQAQHVLDYDGWPGIRVQSAAGGAAAPAVLHSTVVQDVPLWVPLHRAFYDADEVTLAGESYIENHYRLYLDAQAAYQ